MDSEWGHTILIHISFYAEKTPGKCRCLVEIDNAQVILYTSLIYMLLTLLYMKLCINSITSQTYTSRKFKEVNPCSVIDASNIGSLGHCPQYLLPRRNFLLWICIYKILWYIWLYKYISDQWCHCRRVTVTPNKGQFSLSALH